MRREGEESVPSTEALERLSARRYSFADRASELATPVQKPVERLPPTATGSTSLGTMPAEIAARIIEALHNLEPEDLIGLRSLQQASRRMDQFVTTTPALRPFHDATLQRALHQLRGAPLVAALRRHGETLRRRQEPVHLDNPDADLVRAIAERRDR